MSDLSAASVGLPMRPFLYTVDQIATILTMTEQAVHTRILYHEGRDIGSRRTDQMLARNIAASNEKPDWRVAERELVRWMKHKGFKFYERGWVQR